MSEKIPTYCLGGLLTLILSLPATAQQGPAPNFIPDFTFEDSHFDHWSPTGRATWRTENGVITGNGNQGAGWLVLDETYQNVALFSRFKCTGACDAGILMRMQKTPEGTKGVFVEIKEGTLTAYRVQLNSAGEFITKVSVKGDSRPGGGEDAPPGSVLARANAELTAPVTVQHNVWNSIEVIVNENLVYNHLNNVRYAIPGGEIEDLPPLAPNEYNGAVVTPNTRTYGYRPIALYVGAGIIAFDDLSIKNLHLLRNKPEYTSPRFRIQRVNNFYYAWGVDAADINKDGAIDLISGPFYYLGPDFSDRYEFYPARVFNPGLEYVNDMLTFANDWTGDGWIDAVVTERRPLVMYVNPKGENRYWDRVEILPDVCSETAIRADIDGDGAFEIAYINSEGRVAYGEPNPDNPIGPWLTYSVSEPVMVGCSLHAMGVGDVNGDGRADILQARGWWEQPAEGPDKGLWIYHDDWFGRLTRSPMHAGGAEIAVYDFNGDGLNDVVSSLSAHGWGLAWYEQQRDASGRISFVEHMVMDDYSTKNAGDVTFSQVHSGATLGDFDKDGVMDFVTGKRHWSHLDSYMDPDPDGEAVIYWYRTVRDESAPGGVTFEPNLIHNKSGVGSEVKVLDMNDDNQLDILTAGTYGTFIIWGVE